MRVMNYTDLTMLIIMKTINCLNKVTTILTDEYSPQVMQPRFGIHVFQEEDDIGNGRNSISGTNDIAVSGSHGAGVSNRMGHWIKA